MGSNIDTGVDTLNGWFIFYRDQIKSGLTATNGPFIHERDTVQSNVAVLL